MYCTKCGKEITEQGAFCGNCGAPTTKGNPEGETPKPRKRRGGLIAVIVLVLLLLAGTGVFLFTDLKNAPMIRELPGKVTGLFQSWQKQEPQEPVMPETEPTEPAPTETEPPVTEATAPAETEAPEAPTEVLPAAEEEDSNVQATEETEEQQKQQILTDAQTLADSRQFRQAIAMLDDAFAQSGDEAYSAAAAEYRRAFGQDSSSVIAGGKYNTTMISDGVLTVAGNDDFGELAADGWTDVKAVSLGDRYLLALHGDGTVSAAGDMEVPAWENVVAIAAGNRHALALLADGTVVAAGNDENGACDVGAWNHVAAIAAGAEYSAALLTDGTVRITGQNEELLDSDLWQDVETITAGDYFLVGLKQDGTMVAAEVSSVETRSSIITPEKAYEIASARWNQMDGETSPVTGYELSIKQDGLVEDVVGTQFYGFRLQWWVVEDDGPGHRATIDYLFVNAETGETSYTILR